MASEVCESSAGSSAGQEEALAKLAVMSLSSTTDRAQLWREKGITFRPYRDERDMVRIASTTAAALLTVTRSHTSSWQVALGAMVDCDLSEPYSMFTYRRTASALSLPCVYVHACIRIHLNCIPSLSLRCPSSGVFIQSCPSISHLCFHNGQMIGCVVCKVAPHNRLGMHQRC